jgi:starch synthase
LWLDARPLDKPTSELMRILLASSEVHPYSKTGGLADMVGALGKSLARAGHEVGLVAPLYAGICERFPELKRTDYSLDLQLGPGRMQGRVWSSSRIAGFTVYLVEQPHFFHRPTLYHKDGIDYPDNAARFLFLSKAAVHLSRHLPLKPELVHAHDWQTGFVPLLIADQQKRDWPDAPRTCMTIHNLAYQGLFPPTLYPLSNLPWDYFTPDGVEFYGKMSCLKAGIAYAHVITAVSPRYAREIMTQAYGCGFDGLLRHRQSSLSGILNGVDYDEWNTTHDPFLKHPYSAAQIEGKTANKLELQREVGLPVDPGIPLFGSIGRLVEQKGVDIMLGALEEMLHTKLQFVMLGTGAPAFEKGFLDLAARFPLQVAVRIGFDEPLSHRIEAGSDFFLMPSRFEPCGLNQMYSLRYGAIPIVRMTGGLDDTVIDITENVERANGIKFGEYSARALAKGIRKALVLFNEPELFHRFRLNGMAADFSENRTAAQYVKAYERALER